MDKVIKTRDVSFYFPHTTNAFLHDINLEVDAGECILIAGPSGSGKTTVSRLFNGIIPNLVEGKLSGDSQTFNLHAGHAPIEDYVSLVGSVFQNPKTQHFTVNTTNELAFPLENMGVKPQTIKRQIKAISENLEIDHLLDRSIFELSGGEKQQIAFASAMIHQPKLLILDEVTSNLDQEAVQRIRLLVQQLKEQGITILITEHRLAWTKGIVDRYLLFNEGTLINEWSAESFLQLTNDQLKELGLRAMDLNVHRRIIQNKINKEPNEPGLLQTTELSIGYEEPVLNHLNLSFKAGEITAILGPNGTGKSTLAATLTGLERPLKGSILWEGKKIGRKELIKRSFLVMQDTNYQLFTESVEEEVLLGAAFPDKKEEVLGKLGLRNLLDRHPMSLSEGQKQRVAIAAALLSGKKIIIFDEPTSGLDQKNMENFGQLLNQLKDDEIILLVITHDEELVAEWCDRVIELGKQ